ncbi:MATE family efflux transporter [Marinospirillum insulare]|uniref:Multidrug-efflux transporter n=1 Tax=Marinospirillum insulare TaxID=217169 RepID=A0ABQ6A4I4_9GAMM|nr:MATE family efflux transporter [Marinospirillum insulare]GLR65000.1 MATE family efflux transporter [Marinospirillum insulare]
MIATQRRQKILALALPIMGGMLSQSLLNLVDAILVGSLGETVLAGVGVGGYAIFMLSALVAGLSSGVQSQVARRQGAKQYTQLALPLNAAILLALMITLPLSLVGWFNSSWLVAKINPTTAVQTVANDYFQWRVISLLPIALTLSFRGYWHGIQKTGVYFRIIIFTHTLNILLSIWLIHGGLGIQALGATGAALGTSISVTSGALVWGWLTWRNARPNGFLNKSPSFTLLWSLVSLVAPNSLQQFLFAVSYAVLFWFLGQISTASVAVGHVLVHLSLLLILPGVGLGMAAMTLVGHSLGENNQEEAHRWGWEGMRLAAIILAFLGLPMLLAPEAILGLFLHQESLIELGKIPLMLTGIMITLDSAALVFNQALQGAGAHRSVMQISLSMQWLFFLPAAWFLGIYLQGGLIGIWVAQLAYRMINSVVFVRVWQRRRWQGLKV